MGRKKTLSPKHFDLNFLVKKKWVYKKFESKKIQGPKNARLEKFGEKKNFQPTFFNASPLFLKSRRKNVKKLLFLSKKKQDLKTLIFDKKKQIKEQPKIFNSSPFFFLNSSPHFFNSSRINVKELFFFLIKKTH